MIQFLVVTRDVYGNQMEDLGTVDDLRAFLSPGAQEQLSPNINQQQIAPGIFVFQVLPTFASLYELTVLVSGSDVFGGPFFPVVIPAATDAATCVMIIAATGQNLATTPLPMGATVIVALIARDQFGNDQIASGATHDQVSLTWSDHDVTYLGQNGSTWEWSVVTPSHYEVSVITVLVNGQPLGYNPSDHTTSQFAQGVPVTVGQSALVNYSQAQSVQIGLTVAASFLIFVAVFLVGYLVRMRHEYLLQLHGPVFLYLMILGAVLGFACVIVMAVPTVTDLSCAFEAFLGHLGYVLFFGALLAKVTRTASHGRKPPTSVDCALPVLTLVFLLLWCIACSRSLQLVRIKNIYTKPTAGTMQVSERQLVIYLLCSGLLYCGYFALWMIIAPPQPSVSQNNNTQYLSCATEGNIFPTLILVLELALLLYSWYRCYLVHDLQSLQNEAKALMASTLNLTFAGGLLALVVKLFVATPNTQKLFVTIGMLCVPLISLACVFVPVIYFLAIEQDNKVIQARIKAAISSSHLPSELNPAANAPLISLKAKNQPVRSVPAAAAAASAAAPPSSDALVNKAAGGVLLGADDSHRALLLSGDEVRELLHAVSAAHEPSITEPNAPALAAQQHMLELKLARLQLQRESESHAAAEAAYLSAVSAEQAARDMPHPHVSLSSVEASTRASAAVADFPGTGQRLHPALEMQQLIAAHDSQRQPPPASAINERQSAIAALPMLLVPQRTAASPQPMPAATLSDAVESIHINPPSNAAMSALGSPSATAPATSPRDALLFMQPNQPTTSSLAPSEPTRHA